MDSSKPPFYIGSGCQLPFMVYKELFDGWFTVPQINQTHQRSAAFLRSERIAPNQNQESD